jgi:hypothetical protein
MPATGPHRHHRRSLVCVHRKLSNLPARFCERFAHVDAAERLIVERAKVEPQAWTTAGSPDNLVLPNANGVRIEIDRLDMGTSPSARGQERSSA